MRNSYLFTVLEAPTLLPHHLDLEQVNWRHASTVIYYNTHWTARACWDWLWRKIK